MRLVFNSKSADDTIVVAKQIGRQLKGGEIIVLQSDLGGGKTTFVRGLATGMGLTDNINSPTFAITNVYKGQNLELHHYDFYRLDQKIEIMGEELKEVLSDERTVCVIEWPESVMNFLPRDRLMKIMLDRQKDGEDLRLMTIDYPDGLQYLVGGIK